ncbi:MAG: hypothetical protein JXN64_06420 [Spirochaetes bacterium]|nr:hypothetical protein [Spirochaetota bacterium]
MTDIDIKKIDDLLHDFKLDDSKYIFDIIQQIEKERDIAAIEEIKKLKEENNKLLIKKHI